MPFISKEIGAIESTVAGTTGYNSEKSNSEKPFLLSYTKEPGFPIAHQPVLINYHFYFTTQLTDLIFEGLNPLQKFY